ncbi:MAG: hypothetical protein IH965_05080 [Gemmatimonadetes bacterium]|nr:hypothetical protein [Gemmatimonadota bacterium]
MIRILRYFPRLLADYLARRGAAMLLVGVVLMLPVMVAARKAAGGEEFDPTVLLSQGLRNTAQLLILVASYGLIGHDFRTGFYRFVFVKPLSPVGYYAATFVAALLGFQLVLLTLTGIYSVAVRPAWPGTLFLDAAVYFAFIGSLIFAFSRFTRLDWVLGMFLLLLGDLARHAYPKDESFLGAVMNVILPPDPPASFFDAAGVAWGELSWVLGYAAIAFAIGLMTVRVVPMGAAR